MFNGGLSTDESVDVKALGGSLVQSYGEGYELGEIRMSISSHIIEIAVGRRTRPPCSTDDITCRLLSNPMCPIIAINIQL